MYDDRNIRQNNLALLAAMVADIMQARLCMRLTKSPTASVMIAGHPWDYRITDTDLTTIIEGSVALCVAPEKELRLRFHYRRAVGDSNRMLSEHIYEDLLQRERAMRRAHYNRAAKEAA